MSFEIWTKIEKRLVEQGEGKVEGNTQHMDPLKNIPQIQRAFSRIKRINLIYMTIANQTITISVFRFLKCAKSLGDHIYFS